MNSSHDIPVKPSTAFLETYKVLLKGKEADNIDATLERVQSKHGGLAILRSLESDTNNCNIQLFGKDVLGKFVPVGSTQNVNSISRLQFALVTSKKSGNRFIIDLGSIMGTTLLNCESGKYNDELKEMAHEMRWLIGSADTSCLQDTIHGDLYPLFKNEDQRRKMWDFVSRSFDGRLPEPRAGKLHLQSGLQKFDWYPIPKGADQDFAIGDFVYSIDKNSTITVRKMPVAILAPDSPIAPPTNDAREKQADIRIFNACLTVYRDIKNNFALSGAVEEISRSGGIENMVGYPESFKCPVLHQPMREPVMDENGHSYESSITVNLTKSPKTNIVYPPNHRFIPNESLSDLMAQFYKIKGIDPKKLVEDQMKTQVFKR